jgi:sulfite reductase (NADPH) flavoprotein alpha-component
LLLNTTAQTQDELEGTLPAAVRRDLALRKMKLYALDAASFGEQASLAFQLSLLMLNDVVDKPSLGEAVEYIRNALAFPLAHHHSIGLKEMSQFITDVAKNLAPVSVQEQWISDIPAVVALVDGAEAPVVRALPTRIEKSSFVKKLTMLAATKPVEVTPWHQAAQRLMFNDAYDVKHAHRPADSAKEKTFVVTVQTNYPLCPETYDRNVFHIEFSTKGTDLKYAVGDALGVFARNRKCEVDAFLSMYGLDGDDSVSFANAEGLQELRTVRQVVAQVLDLFGRPSRRFYEKLAPFATNETQKEKLEFLAGAEGGFEFKERVERTITFAEILEEFSSARPSVEQLIELVPPIKPRHYSIASAMSMHPDSIHLLIVLVEWETAKGEKRFGQCTKYLVDLEDGAEVSVSVKPSVMILPTDPMAPVLMAGLGTGMAPFRAFIQERAMQAASGIKVGPMSLYFGSRSMFKEYLYGDELEAYHTSGLLTNLRCAFSRDGGKKQYIQHKIAEDAAQLHEYLGESNGQFYLCGPTWPAGDVQDAITAAFESYGGLTPEDAAKAITELKEHERYILEVY